MGKWLEEISVSQKRLQIDEPSRPTRPPAVTEGNLAALEDEPSVPIFPRTASSARALAPLAPAPSSSGGLLPAAHPSVPVVAAPPPLISDLPPRRSSGAGTRLGVTVAVVVMMAAGAAAWFTHLIPHP
jgi:hypothetical protein